MTQTISNPASESVTLLVQQRVKKDQIARYEKWLSAVMKKAEEYQGHQGVHVIKPPAGGTEYSIIIRFDSFASAEKWTKSDDRKKMIDEISDAFEVADHVEIHPGIEFFFNSPTATQRRPKAWKQWLVTTSVIWPLTMIVPALYRPIFSAVPFLATPGLREAIVAATIVALVVFLIMPRYVKAVSGWLYRE